MPTILGVFALSLSFNFVTIPAGTLSMGSPSQEIGRMPDEGPVQSVKVAKFEFQTTEVTQAQWMEVMGNNPSYFKDKSFCPENHTGDMCPTLPVDNISWFAAQEFILALNAKDSKYNYRLPTEAEWEWASRGGTKTAFYFGDTDADLADHAWFDGDYDKGQTHPVATKKPNAYGLYDVYGNVFEWTEDLYSLYPGSDLEPIQIERRRVNKGGDWFSQSRRLRSAFRGATMPGDYNEMAGFRLVRFLK